MKVTIFTDGGARGNPGKAAAAVVVKDESGQIIYRKGKYLGISTNNEAEYQGVILSTEWLLEQKEFEITHIQWKLDSKLVVEQLNRTWKIKEARLAALAQIIWSGLAQVQAQYSFGHVPRAENKDADALVNATLDQVG